LRLLLFVAVAGSLRARGRNGGHADYGGISRYSHDGRSDYDTHQPTCQYANVFALIAYGCHHSNRYIILSHGRSCASAGYAYCASSQAVVNSGRMPHSH
jgi:hypothetical protein